MNKSIFSKLLLSHITVILVSTLTLGILMAYLVHGYVESDRRRIYSGRLDAAITIIDPIIASGAIPDDSILEAVSKMGGCFVWIAKQDGTVLVGRLPRNLTQEDQKMITAFSIDIERQKDGGINKELTLTSKRNEHSAIVLSKPLPSDSSRFLVLYNPFGANKRPAAQLYELLLYSLAAGIITSVIAGFFISRSFTRPIASISRAADCFAKGDYQNRINVATEDEIGQLGRTFNSMAEELSHIEQNRRDFLSTVSHELKTPIASIQALSEAILDGIIDDEAGRKRYLNNILGETSRITFLINDLLELSQLESGQLSMQCDKLDLKKALCSIKARMEPFLGAKNLRLRVETPESSLCAKADTERLNQVLTNLLTNAIRYSFEDSLIVVRAGVNENSNEVFISVINNGSGILPNDLGHIWERFYRADKSRSRQDGGTGLGLAITKKLVEAMLGSISVKSVPGEFTEFTFTLPQS